MGASRTTRGAISSDRRRAGQRNGEEKSRADAAFGLQFQFAAEQFHLPLRDGQSQTGAALMPRAAALMKRLENVHAAPPRDAEAGVNHLKQPAPSGCRSIRSERLRPRW